MSALPSTLQRDIEVNTSLSKLVMRILRQGGSTETVEAYVYDVIEFAKYLGGTPDEILSQRLNWAKVLNGRA